MPEERSARLELPGADPLKESDGSTAGNPWQALSEPCLQASTALRQKGQPLLEARQSRRTRTRPSAQLVDAEGTTLEGGPEGFVDVLVADGGGVETVGVLVGVSDGVGVGVGVGVSVVGVGDGVFEFTYTGGSNVSLGCPLVATFM